MSHTFVRKSLGVLLGLTLAFAEVSSAWTDATVITIYLEPAGGPLEILEEKGELY